MTESASGRHTAFCKVLGGSNESVIVHAIVLMARSLGETIVAEGMKVPASSRGCKWLAVAPGRAFSCRAR